MTRLAPVASLADDTLDVWTNLTEARQTLARIGADPEWQQHRRDAEAEAHPPVVRAKTAVVWSEVADEAVFFDSMGMPVADVCERLGQKAGPIARALRRIGETDLADKFEAVAKAQRKAAYRARGAA